MGECLECEGECFGKNCICMGFCYEDKCIENGRLVFIFLIEVCENNFFYSSSVIYI